MAHVKEYFKELIYIAIALVLVDLITGWHGIGAWLIGYSHHALVALLAIPIAAVVFLARIWREVFIISSQHQQTPEHLRRPLSLFMQHRLSVLNETRSELRSEHGLQLSLGEMERFVSACFAANAGKQYIGTDSSTPSEFQRRYPTYLDEHFSNRGRWGNWGLYRPVQDFRFLLVTEEDLRRDYRERKLWFEAFVKGHLQHSVRLYQVDPNVAREFVEVYRLPASDLGLFGGRFVAYFIPPSDEELAAVAVEAAQAAGNGINLRYRIFVEQIEAQNRNRLRSYLRMLNEYAKEVRLDNRAVIFRERTDADKQADIRQLDWATKPILMRMRQLNEDQRP